jgi:hypothetical protein
MPKKIKFQKISDNKYIYETKPIVDESRYYSQITLPISIGREVKGKKLKVTIEVLR